MLTADGEDDSHSVASANGRLLDGRPIPTGELRITREDDVLRAIRFLVLGLTALLAPWPAGAQSALDHLTCVKAGIAEPKAHFHVVLGSPVAQPCVVKTPARTVCTETTGTTVTPSLPGGSEDSGIGSMLCYALKCEQGVGSQGQLQDAFGQHTVTWRVPRWLCVQATSVGETTTTTFPGGSTTTTVPSSGCHYADGQCTGSCAPGSKCGAAVGTGSCECRSVSCGEADAPQCNGACADPSDACVFMISGCSCVHIP
jgi:hypothetical protein